MRILGLDEAGRGCVLGPLVVGAFCCTAQQQPQLKAAGAADSKAISHKRRLAARAALPALGEGAVVEISPQQIDAGNLNQLEEQAFIQLILRFLPDVVYLDAPVHPRGIPKLQARMVAAVAAVAAGAAVGKWVIQPKADATFPVVGAASIYAKVHRDGIIADIDAQIGPIGSGYPSDPVTRRWLSARLAETGPLPSCVRTRWATLEKLRQQAMF